MGLFLGTNNLIPASGGGGGGGLPGAGSVTVNGVTYNNVIQPTTLAELNQFPHYSWDSIFQDNESSVGNAFNTFNAPNYNSANIRFTGEGTNGAPNIVNNLWRPSNTNVTGFQNAPNITTSTSNVIYNRTGAGIINWFNVSLTQSIYSAADRNLTGFNITGSVVINIDGNDITFNIDSDFTRNNTDATATIMHGLNRFWGYPFVHDRTNVNYIYGGNTVRTGNVVEQNDGFLYNTELNPVFDADGFCTNYPSGQQADYFMRANNSHFLFGLPSIYFSTNFTVTLTIDSTTRGTTNGSSYGGNFKANIIEL